MMMKFYPWTGASNHYDLVEMADINNSAGECRISADTNTPVTRVSADSAASADITWYEYNRVVMGNCSISKRRICHSFWRETS